MKDFTYWTPFTIDGLVEAGKNHVRNGEAYVRLEDIRNFFYEVTGELPDIDSFNLKDEIQDLVDGLNNNAQRCAELYFENNKPKGDNANTVEIDLSDFGKDELVGILHEMHERDMTFNEFIVYTLEEMIRRDNGTER